MISILFQFILFWLSNTFLPDISQMLLIDPFAYLNPILLTLIDLISNWSLKIRWGHPIKDKISNVILHEKSSWEDYNQPSQLGFSGRFCRSPKHEMQNLISLKEPFSVQIFGCPELSVELEKEANDCLTFEGMMRSIDWELIWQGSLWSLHYHYKLPKNSSSSVKYLHKIICP